MSGTAFPEIRGHAALLSALDRALVEDRLASALLFHGPAGVGKLSAALALLRALLCASAPRPCGECSSCRKLAAGLLLHPDVGLLYPQKGQGSDAGREEDESAEGSGPAGGALDLHALQDQARRNASWRILADRTRDRLRELALSPGLGPRRALLILCAERLGGVSGNILLKVLEEPPGGSVILLLCENPSVLLPTLRSRCQSCRFSPLPREVVERLLLERSAAPAGEARLIASLSGGRIGAALELARDPEAYRSRRGALAPLLASLRRDRSAAACVAAAGALLSEKTDTMEDLSILMDLLRDAMLAAAGCPASLLTDSGEAGPGAAPTIPLWEAPALLARVERAREDLRRNINRQTAVEALLLDLTCPDPLSLHRE